MRKYIYSKLNIHNFRTKLLCKFQWWFYNEVIQGCVPHAPIHYSSRCHPEEWNDEGSGHCHGIVCSTSQRRNPKTADSEILSLKQNRTGI